MIQFAYHSVYRQPIARLVYIIYLYDIYGRFKYTSILFSYYNNNILNSHLYDARMVCKGVVRYAEILIIRKLRHLEIRTLSPLYNIFYCQAQRQLEVLRYGTI